MLERLAEAVLAMMVAVALAMTVVSAPGPDPSRVTEYDRILNPRRRGSTSRVMSGVNERRGFARHPEAQVGRGGGVSRGGGGDGGDDAGGGVGGCDGGDDGGGVDGGGDDGDDGGGDDGDAGGGGDGGGDGSDDGGGGGGDENRVFIEVPSPVTKFEAPRFRSRHDANLAHASTDLTTEYAVCDGMEAAVAALFRTGLRTVPDRPPAATAAATSSSSTPTAGAASSFRTGLGTVPVRFRAVVVVAAVVGVAAVVVVAAAAWLTSCGGMTYVAVPCSRARARRAAADGRAV